MNKYKVKVFVCYGLYCRREMMINVDKSIYLKVQLEVSWLFFFLKMFYGNYLVGSCFLCRKYIMIIV